MTGMLLDDWHRVTGVSHLWKYDQFGASFFGTLRKVANFGEIRFRITERTSNLSDCDFHRIVILSKAKNLGSLAEIDRCDRVF